MFLAEPAETPFDLRFWLFGTHVRVHPWFWLMSAVLGWGATGEGGATGMLYLGLWVACVFVSVLIHEFGHVFMGRLFGSHGHIVLHSWGGLAIGSASLSKRWQRVLVMFAGPLAQFILLGVVLIAAVLILPKVPPAWQDLATFVARMLVWINLVWALINLLPIWPLDGGQMTNEVFSAVSPRNGAYAALVVSAALSGLVALHFAFPAPLAQLLQRFFPAALDFEYADALLHRDIYLAIFFGLFCAQSIMGVMAENARRQRRYNEEEEFPWER